MFENFYANMCPVYVYTLLHQCIPNTYLHTFTPTHLYLFTTFYARISRYAYEILQPLIDMFLHNTTPIYLYMTTYIYAYTCIHVYILLRPYMYTCLLISTPIYTIHMFTYIYAHIRPIHVCIYFYHHIPKHVNMLNTNISIHKYILLRPYKIYTLLYTSSLIYLYILLRHFAPYICLHTTHILEPVHIILRQYY